jgi:hypothetical protein
MKNVRNFGGHTPKLFDFGGISCAPIFAFFGGTPLSEGTSMEHPIRFYDEERQEFQGTYPKIDCFLGYNLESVHN